MNELEVVEEAWSIPKIIIGVVSLITVVGGGLYLKSNYFDTNTSGNIHQKKTAVEGVTTSSEDGNGSSTKKDSPTLPNFSPDNIRVDIQNKVDEIKKQIISLNPSEIASSSPQVQKIIQDMKSIQDYPKNQAKEMCENICKSL